MRTAKEIVLASRPFAQEHRWTSWWCLGSTLALYVMLAVLAARDGYLPVRIAASVLAGLTLVRLFILFHDHQHGTILRDSRLASLLMKGFGLLSLNPTSVWKRSHDHHHRHNSRNFNPNIGSFPLMTVDGYENATMMTRFGYGLSRHPLTLVFAYFTVFAGKMCLGPLLCNPRRHWDAALSLVCHAIVGWLVFRDIDSILLGWVVPFVVGSGCGAYLFFAQHNFPGVKLQPDGEWDYVTSALRSSSYFAMGPVMRWFTGNIGYHHVHHLNAKIPFYRLPEAMAAIEELQSPTTITLSIKDILACLRLKLWDPVKGELVHWPPARPRPNLLPALNLQAEKAF
jgi:omega-6 fatty acid desaturase (delta-12 desaturase)